MADWKAVPMAKHSADQMADSTVALSAVKWAQSSVGKMAER
jgi:hypothetical protein